MSAPENETAPLGHGPHAHTHRHAAPAAARQGPRGAEDAAARSLADALRVCFGVLKWIMIALAAAFLFSGWFNVNEGQVAIRLRFGALQAESNGQVLEPGGPYFALPEPLDEVIFITTTERQLSLDQAFWFEVRKGDELKSLDDLRTDKSGLSPKTDGYLLTGDKNIVHAKWSVIYRVPPSDAPLFAACMTAGNNIRQTEARAQQIVRTAAERAVVRLAAETTAEQLLSSAVERESMNAKRRIQKSLDDLKTGIQVTSVLLQGKPTPPLKARPEFRAMNEAHSEKAEKLEVARQLRSKILNESAGAAYPQLLAAIDAYEAARLEKDENAIQRTESEVAAILEGGTLSGQAKRILNEASSERTRMVSAIHAEAETFNRLLPLFEKSASLVKNMLWQEAMKEILTGDVETFYLPPGQKTIRLEMKRDPKIQKERETEQYKSKAEEARESGVSSEQ